MTYPFPPELNRLIIQQMAAGSYESEDELLFDALRALAVRNADMVAVEQAVSDMEAGDRGRPLIEVATEIRKKHGWTKD